MTHLNNQSDQDSTNRQNILNALDFEITQIQHEYSRPGWTLWALLGALSTSIWLLLDEIEKTKINFHYGFFAFLTISIVLDGFSLLKFLTSSESRSSKAGVSKFFTDLFKVRHIVLLFLIRTVLILYIGYIYKSWVPKLSITLFFTYYGVGVLLLLVFLALSFTRFPIIRSGTKYPFPAKWLKRLLVFFIIIGAIIIAYGYLEACINAQSFLRAPEYRFGGLLWTIGFIVLKLGMGVYTPILLESLIELRRDLLFDRINTSSAKRQMGIILSGLEVSDLLQEDIREIYRLYDEVNKEFKIEIDRIKLADSLLSEALQKNTHDDNSQLMEAAIETCMLNTGEIRKKLKELHEKINKFGKRINQLISFYPQTKEPLKLLIVEKFMNAFDSINKDFDSLEMTMNNLYKKCLAKNE